MRAGSLTVGMDTNPYWLVDDGHGWLVVPMSAVVASGAYISCFSRVSPDGRCAYLEEDCDARAFVDAARFDRVTTRKWPIKRVGHAECRHYPSFLATVDRE